MEKTLSNHINGIRSKTSYLFYPKDLKTKVWDILMILALLVVTFGVTLEMSFFIAPPNIAFLSEVTLTALFLLDIFINFNRVIVFKKRKRLLIKRSEIACYYIKRWFVLDLISFFPFFIFSHKFKMRAMKGYQPAKMSPFVDFMRLLRILKTFKHILKNDSFLNKSIQGFKGKKKNTMSQMMSHMILIIVFCHLFACIFYSVPLSVSPEHNWVFYRGLQEKDILEKYLSSMHWIIQTMITVGYGDNVIR